MSGSKLSLFNQPRETNSISTETKYFDAFNLLTQSFKDVRQLDAQEISQLKQSLSGIPLNPQVKQNLQLLSSPQHQQSMKTLSKDNRKKLLKLFQDRGLMDLLAPPHIGLEEKSVKPAIQPLDETSEINDIQSGYYRRQLYEFTYYCITPDYNIFECRGDEPWKKLNHSLYPLVNRPGFRCTAAIAEGATDPIEIQINFFGTMDFASKYADIDNGGPGQDTLKRYEKELLLKINDMIKNIDTHGKPIRLKLAGHSLGGSLAKGFCHSIQRACAVQNKTPQEIIDAIKAHPNAQDLVINEPRLLKKLTKDQGQFAGLSELRKISGVTVYALGAPGVSKETDQDATAMSYCQENHFLRVYNQYHEKDLIRKFGESEFLSGKHGRPNIITHKSFIYDFEISQEKKNAAKALPFPNTGQSVMALHNATIYANTKHKIIDTLDDTEEKFVFPLYLWVVYKIAFFIAAQIAKLVNRGKLYSYPETEIATPHFNMG